MHDDELDVDEELVSRLLGTLSPAYAGLPLRRFDATGSTNALFRLGDELLVRVPRQPGGTATIEKEQRWLPMVAQHLPVAVPEVVAVGEPAFGYPERWSVVRYLTGERPDVPRPGEAPRHELASDLAGVVHALRGMPVPPEAVGDPDLEWYRGRALASMDEDLHRFLEECEELLGKDGLDLDLEGVRRVWAATLQLPRASSISAPTWYHGDLNAENLLLREGRLVAVLDFGGLSLGDPTNDLAVAWQLLDPAARATFRSELGVDDETWQVARGWALVLALMGPGYYWHTMRERCLRGLHTAREVLADAAAEGV
ncbi:MAG: aminoglycoside phosphotransferase family protein [Nocardioides sp.]